jgi:AcrR family transcriptional regulator
MGTTLTRKGLATRQRIVAGAAELFRERGVAGTSLDDVCEATSTSKSQLFHYFADGRTQLLAAVAQHEADRVLEDQQPAIDQLTSWAAWQAWRDRVVERYRAQGQSCPLAVLTSQLGPGSPEHQEVVVGLFRRWQRKIADGIRTMQASGDIESSMDADRRAAALLAGLQGGVLIMLATGEIAHLEVALDEGIAALRGVPGAAQNGAGEPAGQDGRGEPAGQDGRGEPADLHGRGGSAALDGGGA